MLLYNSFLYIQIICVTNIIFFCKNYFKILSSIIRFIGSEFVTKKKLYVKNFKIIFDSKSFIAIGNDTDLTVLY